jgi:hypothetical protein
MRKRTGRLIVTSGHYLAGGRRVFCPKCGEEYRPGFSECYDCQVPLVEQLPKAEPSSPSQPACCFCPKCGAEYRPGFSECNDCGVPLVHRTGDDELPSTLPVDEEPGELPPDSETHSRLVIVRRFTTEFEAQIAEAALVAAGIQATLSKDDCGGMRPALALTQGVDLFVWAEDAPAAMDVLDAGASTQAEASGEVRDS